MAQAEKQMTPEELDIALRVLTDLRNGQLPALNFSFPPQVRDGLRYDRCTVGYHFMPWLHDPAFLRLYALAERIETGSYNGMFVAPRAYVLLKAAEAALSLEAGDFVECGVYKGGTALLASEVILLAEPGARPRFHLFDTFGGSRAEDLPPGTSRFEDVTLEMTQRNLARYSEILEYHPGYVPESLRSFAPHAIRYLHIDINTAKAHAECVEFFVPRLVDGAVVLFDDYGWPGFEGCKRAVDECLRQHGLPLPVALATGQAIYVHNRRLKRLLPF